MLELIKELPDDLEGDAIEKSIEKFIEETELPADKTGLFNQTLEAFAKSLLFKDPLIDIWISKKEGSVNGYVIARIVKDIDNSVCYWISQAWCDIHMRANGFTKESWENLKKRAYDIQAKHIVVVSCRNDDAFNRFLGGEFKKYATLLTMDLN